MFFTCAYTIIKKSDAGLFHRISLLSIEKKNRFIHFALGYILSCKIERVKWNSSNKMQLHVPLILWLCACETFVLHLREIPS